MVPRAGRSIAIMTGMIIAALYVILLVGFSRESYMRRDAEWRAEAASPAPTMAEGTPVCRPEPRCTSLMLDKR